MSNLIECTIAEIPPAQNPQIAELVRARWDSLTKPRGSLGVLEAAVVKLAEIQNSTTPAVNPAGVFVFCGEHGIAEEGVSLYPTAVTREMARNFVRGGAAINVLARHLGLETTIIDAGLSGPKIEGVVDLRVADGTRNFLHEPAMSRQQAVRALECGIALAQQASSRLRVAIAGEMGIGNSTSASALICALIGAHPEHAVGRGAGLDENGIAHKREVVTATLSKHRVNTKDPIEVLAAFGGFEIAMMAGFFLGAASRRLPIIVDGFISGAAFIVAQALYPPLSDHVFFGHRSAERGSTLVLKAAQSNALLDIGLCLGEGTGAALAYSVLTSAMRLYSEMATFEEADVSDHA